jgi:hypothetical protein
MRLGRRASTAGVLALLLSCGASGIAAAATTPAPQISPPPQCFLEKNGALPLCTANPDGSWTVTYPTGGGNLDDSSGGGSSTKHDVGLAIVIVCAIGIVGIVVWQWVLPRRRNRQSAGAPPMVAGVPVTQATASAYYPDDHVPPATPAAAPPPASQPMVTEAVAAQLTSLNTLLSQGQITREEYDARREAILSGM